MAKINKSHLRNEFHAELQEDSDTIPKGALSRYTTWSTFQYWLKNEKFVFGKYAHWEDKSDVAVMDAYAKKKKQQVRVFCLMDRSGTYKDCIYHWSGYTKSKDGIRVDFDKDKLLEYLKQKNINTEKYAREVKYPETKDLKEWGKDYENWPFIKRASYDVDKEYRILCVGNPKPDKKNPLPEDAPLEFDFKKDWFKDCIKRITVSSLFSAEKFLEIKAFLTEYGIKGVYRSKIYRYKKWEKTLLNSST